MTSKFQLASRTAKSVGGGFARDEPVQFNNSAF